MPYINQLQEKNKALDAQLKAAQAETAQFMTFLGTSKFTGTDEDGSRKDWISTGDLYAWLQNHRTNLMTE